MTVRCYFCNNSINNAAQVRMWDDRIVPSCLVCRRIVADTKRPETHQNDNSVLEIVGGDQKR